MFVLAADELAALADHHGHPDSAARLRDARRTMDAAVRARGWNGVVPPGVYDYFGDPVGAAENERRGSSSSRRACASPPASGSTTARRSTPSPRWPLTWRLPGIVLQQPPYTRYHVELGEISSYPPGYKENAGIFCHTNPWVMIAETRIGNGDRALDYYLRINPSAREAISDQHRCEPYVYAQMIAGKDASLRRGQELVADRHGRLEPRRHHPVDPRPPP